jgi:hypothetical protein
MQKELQLLGLTSNEASVYEALVQEGPCKAGLLINKLDLHRTLIYRALDSLVLNGHVTKIVKNGVWHFQISDPQSFLISMNRQEVVLSELMKTINERQHRASSQIVVYEGLGSYRNYWMRSIERFPDGTVDYIAGGEIELWTTHMGKLKEEYLKRVRQKKMSWKSLYLDPLSEHERKLLAQANVPTECRVWPRPDAHFFGNFNVLGDTVILQTPSQKMPRIIEMRDPALVKMFKAMFDLMWAEAKPVEL